MDNQSFSEPIKFKGVIQLLKESWQIYCSKIKTLLGIIALPVGFGLLFRILMFVLKTFEYSIWFYVLGVILYYLVSLFFGSWAAPALLFSLKENTGIKESYQKGLKILISYVWVYFLGSIIALSGFLLFIIPGIIFAIWLSLAVYALVFEGKRGMNALLRSKQLVAGRWWGVFWRFLIFGLVVTFIVIIIGVFLSFLILALSGKTLTELTENVITYFLQLFFVPLVLIYGVLIYKNLTEIKKEVSYQQPSKKEKLKYILLGVLGVLLFIPIITFISLSVFLGRDEPPVDGSELWLSKIEISKEENAFYPFIQTSEKIYLPKEKSELFEKMVKGEKWNSEFAEELIKNNEEVFDYFEKALKLSYFQIPEFQDPKTIGHEPFISSNSGLIDIAKLAKLNSIKANYLLTQGKEKEALDLIIKTIKMGQLIEDSPRPLLISYLLSVVIKEIGLQRLRMIIPNLTLSPETLKDYIAELNQFKTNKEGLIRMIKMEYIFSTNEKSIIDAAFTGKLPKEKLEKLGVKELSFEGKTLAKLNYFYKPNQTQRMFVEYYRNLVNNANKDCNEMKLLEIKPLTPHSKIKMLFTGNVVGKSLYNILVTALPHFFEKKCLVDFSVIGTQSLMALKAYQTETGKIPFSLEQLVPGYFPEVPKDPFDGKIRYSPEKKIIYSVGKDLIDSGGSEGENWQEMADPTFKIEF
jgi:tetratricopeptide (TPR) repeat protein